MQGIFMWASKSISVHSASIKNKSILTLLSDERISTVISRTVIQMSVETHSILNINCWFTLIWQRAHHISCKNSLNDQRTKITIFAVRVACPASAFPSMFWISPQQIELQHQNHLKLANDMKYVDQPDHAANFQACSHKEPHIAPDAPCNDQLSLEQPEITFHGRSFCIWELYNLIASNCYPWDKWNVKKLKPRAIFLY